MITKFLIFALLAYLIAANPPNYKPKPPPGVLEGGKCLNKGDYIDSPRGCYRFIMQYDGNLVAYHRIDGSPQRAIWAAGTYPSGSKVCMQDDGNLVVGDYPLSHPIWATMTHGNPKARLSVQDDGNLVIYAFESDNALWASGSMGEHCCC